MVDFSLCCTPGFIIDIARAMARNQCVDAHHLTLRVQVVLIYGFWAPKSLNSDYLDPEG